MNNIYNNSEYAAIQENMHKRLQEMKDKYGDSDALMQENLDRFLSKKGIAKVRVE